ncbi:short chain type dehydrogenase [Fusarium acutatum]|uniref:Short chain type dehydrogenase n=1 Tax=Fusarium acutatum TaxID=78861 RepID=A0A8H4JKX2_9HYPO|nr:short chain type dehydrogenase [Fusarium acutatum]
MVEQTLAGKVALVSGAAWGIANECFAIEADLQTVQGPQKLIDDTVTRLKGRKIDILINNAGIAIMKPMAEATLDQWDKQVNLNCRGMFLLTQAVLPHLSKKNCRIINASSAGARLGTRGSTIYNGSKAMVEGFTRCWAVEFGRDYDCTVNAYCPGPTKTHGFQHAGDKFLASLQPILEATPKAGRMADPSEIANAVGLLCEEKAGWITGSGQTSRPTAVDAYRLKDMARDVVEILDHEQVEQAFAVGHDWGSHVLGRLAVYFPKRLVKLAFITVGYIPPGNPVDIDLANERSKKVLGYPVFGYQVFLTRYNGVEAIFNQHKESVLSLIYAQETALWKDHMGPVGALQDWVNADKRATWGEYLTEKDHRIRKEMTADELGGLPTLAWYKAHAWNLNHEVEKDIAENAKYLRHPTLYLASAKDYLAVPRLQIPQMESWVPSLEVQEIDSGHWVFLHRPAVVNEALKAFFSK